MKTCPACKHQNLADALICESCGDSLGIGSGWEKTTIRGTHLEAFAPGYLVAERYEIVKEIGRGGMGVVYRVRDTRLQSREMALKMIHPQLVELPEAQQRFEQEVNTCLDLLHSNIVRVHNLEEWQGQQFFTMEYISGRSLQELIAERKPQKPPFTLSEAAAIILPVLDALSYAHQYTIHRDIKPDNIIVIGDFPDVTVKVLDFGIAKTLSTSGFTQTAQVLGTAFYMAPEQMSGSEIDHRADLYSTGMIFYEILTGQMAVGRFRLPGEIVTGLPKTVDQVIEKALAPSPEQRYTDAAAMSQALKRVVSKSGLETEAAPVAERPAPASVADTGPEVAQVEMRIPPAVSTGTQQKFKPWMYAAAAVLFVLLAVSAIFWIQNRKATDTTVQTTQKEQIKPKAKVEKEPTVGKTVSTERTTSEPMTQQTQLQQKLPNLTSETYLFSLNEKALKRLKLLALASVKNNATDLKKSFQEKGFKIALMPKSEAPRALETGIVDGIVTTSKEVMFDLKKKFPKGVSLQLYPEISKLDQKPQISKPDEIYGETGSKKAALENETGAIVMHLNRLKKFKVLSKDRNEKLWVEVVGWISEYRTMKSEEDHYVKNPKAETARLWETPQMRQEEGEASARAAIGDVTDAALLIPVGEVRTLNKPDYVKFGKYGTIKVGPPTKYIRVKIYGWISEEFISEGKPAAKDSGKIAGKDLKADELFLKPGNKKCNAYRFNGLGTFGGRATFRVTSTDTPSFLEYITENVKVGKYAGVTVNYCLTAKKNAQPGIHEVEVEYSFYNFPFRSTPYAVKKVQVSVHIVQP